MLNYTKNNGNGDTPLPTAICGTLQSILVLLFCVFKRENMNNNEVRKCASGYDSVYLYACV